jgi:hypothetical protein
VLAAAAAARREGREAKELAAVRETLPIASFREQITSMVDQHQVSPTLHQLGLCRHIVTGPYQSLIRALNHSDPPALLPASADSSDGTR